LAAVFCPASEFALESREARYIAAVKFLTKQEQLVLCLVFGLLLVGWAVKTWRAAHEPAAVAQTQRL